MAQSTDNVGSANSADSMTKQQPKTSKTPTTVYFDITAYYSPLPDQQRYVTGSYESDIRLNGSGVHGADGTPVYPGMVAAPRIYPFGTKMKIPGVGTVAVHDRGGAIVASNSPDAHDRLDIWMGYGDKGLSRALGWGRRIVPVTMYGIDPSVKESVYLEGYSEVESIVRHVVSTPSLFPEDVWYESNGNDVVKLQRMLQSMGYTTPIDGFYGDDTRKAVMTFQRDRGLIRDETDLGAGHTGFQTRIALDKALVERKKELLPRSSSLGSGVQGVDVRRLQEMLKMLGYSIRVTGVFDAQTADAVYQFQYDNKLVTSTHDFGAGHFGPKTSQSLSRAYVASLNSTASVSLAAVPNYLVASLRPGENGAHVRRLQEELVRLNFMRIAPTGTYGDVTQHAVLKFQQAHGIVGGAGASDAGVFTDATRGALNNIIASRFYTERLIASQRDAGRAVASKDSSTLIGSR